MSGTRNIWMVGMVGLALTAGLARAEFSDDMLAAAQLRKDGKHKEAIQAYLALAEQAPDDDRRFEAVCAAARCARLDTPSGEARALTLCDQAGPDPYPKACRATIYYWMTSPSNVVTDLGAEEIAAWPEALAVVGFSARGRAHLFLKNGPAAVADFVKVYQFGNLFGKMDGLKWLGDTYWKLLDDTVLAEAFYRKCMAMGPGSTPGLLARINLGALRTEEGRHDDALKVLNDFLPRASGCWKADMLLGIAKTHIAAGQAEQARDALEAVPASPGVLSHQVKAAEQLKASLKQ